MLVEQSTAINDAFLYEIFFGTVLLKDVVLLIIHYVISDCIILDIDR